MPHRGRAEKLASLQVEATGAPELSLRGKDARQQLLVTGKLADGQLRDFTHKAIYQVSPAGIVSVDAEGLASAISDGAATVTVTAEGAQGSLTVKVEGASQNRPINFANQIVPIFTKAGCNSGGCHGKSSGQNGFKLSLLGFEPAEDYEHLVKEARGRRVFPAAPENSLLLLKGIGTMPHGGGKRLDPKSDDYRLLVRWIGQGLPYGSESDPKLTGIEVLPKQRTMPLNGDQQLVVLAHYTDGSVEDVTRSALYEPNEKTHGEGRGRRARDAFRSAGRCRRDGALSGQGRRLSRDRPARGAGRSSAARRAISSMSKSSRSSRRWACRPPIRATTPPSSAA